MQKNKAVLALGVLIVAVVAAVVIINIVSPNMLKKPFMVVSTPSGFYVGRVTFMPFSSFAAIKDGYILSDVRNDKNEVVDQQLIPLAKNTIWAPGTLYLNKSQILFKGVVGQCSSIDRTLRPDNACPKPQAQGQQAPAGNVPPATPAK